MSGKGSRIRHILKRREKGIKRPHEFKWYHLTYWKIRRGRLKHRFNIFKDKCRSRRCRRNLLHDIQTRAGMKTGTYRRLGTLSLEEVLPLIGVETSATFFGEKVKLTSRRYKCFKGRGTRCVDCGLKGHYFAVERHRYQNRLTSPYHLNLYHKNADGHEILLTVDHIIPKAQNGSNSIKNLQPMCSPCNAVKADVMPSKKRPYKGKIKETRPPEECKISKIKKVVDFSTI